MNWDRIRKFFGLHVHERKVFCVGNLAFVKCVTCGHESIPWEVPEKTAKDWRRSHPNAIAELKTIQSRLRELQK